MGNVNEQKLIDKNKFAQTNILNESNIIEQLKIYKDLMPQQVAVKSDSEILTYKEFDDKSNQLANYIKLKYNTAPGSFIGVLMRQSAERLASILAILKSNCAFIIIEPELAEDSIKAIIEDNSIRLLISEKENIKKLNRLLWECKTLESFLCMDSEDIYSEIEEENIAGHSELWEYVGSVSRNSIDGGGWMNSYTGQYFTEEEMNEYSSNVFLKLKQNLHKECKVLEIGCSTGLSMYKIAPYVGLYYGTDVSSSIIKRNEHTLIKQNIDNIRLDCIPAHEIDRVKLYGFDVVILNSVVQLFNGHNYLRNVITKVIDLMGEKGVIFIGDVMDLDKREELIYSLNCFKQNNFNDRFRTKTDFSNELFISKNFFEDMKVDIKEIENIRISDKIHTIKNELTEYRYDVILEINRNTVKEYSCEKKHKYQDDIAALRKYSSVFETNEIAPDSIAWLIYTLDGSGNKNRLLIQHNNEIRINKDTNYNNAEALQAVQLLLTGLEGHFIEKYSSFLEALCGRLQELGKITEEEKNRIVYEFNDTSTQYPKDKSLKVLFEEQVERTPDNIAIIFNNLSFTYRQINKRANRLSKILLENGIQSNDVVGILSKRSPMSIIGMIAILKAGGVYLPIDANYPSERIKYMLEESKVKVLLLSDSDDEFDFSGKLLTIDQAADSNYDNTNPDICSKPEDLAYIMYTSGSTGKPKGVMIEHRNVVRLVKNTNYIEFKDGDCILQTGNLTFDACTFEIWGALLNGLKLVIVEDNTIINEEELEKAILQNHATIMWLTSPLFNQLSQRRPGMFSGLRHLLVGGDALSPRHIDRVRRECKNLKIINGYGPTENTTFSTYFPIEGDYSENIPIGKPISNSTVYIVDSSMNLVPPGIPGELCVGGDGIARGYLNDEQLTKEKFLQNIFKYGERIYRTGDMARWLPDGNIEFLGRIDRQVKIRGFRIELLEIESCLLAHESVNEAIVLLWEKDEGDKILCAYFTSAEVLPVSEIRTYIAKELPDYMVPSFFIRMESMPLNKNGKIDRNSLPSPDIWQNNNDYEAPANETEAKIQTIWQEILGYNKISVNKSFFELGGHSLKASILASRVRKGFNLELGLEVVFKYTTIKTLAEYINNQRRSDLYPSIESIEEKEYYPVSSAQKRLFLLYQLEGSKTTYNAPIVMRVKGNINIRLFEYAFELLIRRHEILRTSFHIVDGEAVQKVHTSAEMKLNYRKCSGDDLEAIISGFIQPFDIGTPPLIRADLVNLGDGDHLFLIDMHHIVTDGISVNILLEEFSDICKGAILPEPRIHYKDYSVWQRNLLESEIITPQKEFWLDIFKDDIPLLNMPADFPRPLQKSFEGDKVRFEIDSDMLGSLKELSSKSGTTLYMVLLSAFYVLLSKYSNQEDIVIGTPTAGRQNADLENLVGVFVNTLALRNYPSKEKRFADFLGEVKDSVLKAFDNQGYQFEKLVETLGNTRDAGRNPLFDVMFVLQNMGAPKIEIPDLTFMPQEFEFSTAKFDLTLTGEEQNSSLKFGLEYCKKLFRRETITRFSLQYIYLLEQIIQKPDIKLSDITLITEEEKRQIITNFNDTDAGFPENKTIHGIFEEQAERWPENTALQLGNKKLTYAELNKQANQLARVLRTKGVGRDKIVGVLAERSLEMIISILAILKAGGAYLPIEPEFPDDRVRYILEDSQAEVLVVQKHLLNKVNQQCSVVVLEDREISKYNGDNLDNINKPKDLAYIIYTSGTTGRPKGVMIEHRNVVRLLHNDRSEFTFDENDVWTMFHSYCFDFSVWEMYGALLYGGKLLLVPKYAAKEPKEFLSLLKEERVTVLNQTPTYFYNLLNEEIECHDKLLGLRYIIFGGEALKPGKLERWYRKYPSTKLVNMYGITETTVHVTYKEITLHEIELNKSNIGRPIPTTKTYIMDQGLNLLPIGVPGELFVGGEGVGRGYLNKAELTREKFIENPYIAGDRLYRSGDLAKLLPNGEMEYMGRIDHQVKIRGFRIELGEIEYVLLKHEGIKETIVIDKEDASGNRYLCAYLVTAENLTALHIREYLSGKLPDYMIPAYFIRIDSIPVTRNGKVNLTELPRPDSSSITGIEYAYPLNWIEEKLLRIWIEVLKIETGGIGTKHNYFLLGGDSIRSIELMSKINKEFGTNLKIADLYSNPTIHGMGELLKEKINKIEDGNEEINKVRNDIESFKNSILSVADCDVEDLYPMSSIQIGMVYYTLKYPEDSFYHDQIVYEFKEREYDFNSFKKALYLIAGKHSILRTSFNISDYSTPVQIIHKSIDIDVEQIDISDRGKREQDDYIREYLKADKAAGLNISDSPLWRIRIINLSSDHLCLCLITHHAILDGWSVASFLTELVNTYLGLKRENIGLSMLKSSYKDYVVEELAARNRTDIYEYWKKELDGYKRLNLHPEKGDEENKNFCFYTYQMEYTLLKELHSISAERNQSLRALCFAAYIYMLGMISYENDIVVGLVEHNRPLREDGDKVLGCFLNTVPVRVKLDSKYTWKEYAEYIDSKLNNLKPFTQASLSDILKMLGEESSDQNPIFDTFFNYVDFHVYDKMAKKDDEHMLVLKPDYVYTRTNTMLDVTVSTTGNEFEIMISCLEGQFSRERLSILTDYFINSLKALIYNPDEEMRKIHVLPEEDKNRVLYQYNDTFRSYPDYKTIHELFEEQAQKTPKATALVFEGSVMTYEELNGKANQLAWFLRKKGVEAGTVVGILLERSFELIISLLAIIKAGGTCLPIDQQTPWKRLQLILKESGMKTLLTNQNLSADIKNSISGDCEEANPGKCTLKNIILIDTISEEISGERRDNLHNVNTPDDFLYIIYTSGSTGIPKGVVIKHRNMVNLICFEYDCTNIDFSGSVLQFASIGFDVSFQEIFSTLLCGGRLFLLRKEKRDNIMGLLDMIDENSIEVLFLPPALLKFVFSEKEYMEKFPQRVKQIIAAGESLMVTEELKCFLRDNKIVLHNHYGPSETHVVTTYTMYPDGDAPEFPPIGKPISNTRVYILNESMDIQPTGVFGEMYISGDCVGAGYFNLKELTAERFLRNPYNPSEILYKTGDLARWLSDGNIEFSGRIDSQVKIRGFRIELEEIEAQLIKHPSVKSAAVIDRVDKDGSRYLCAYIVYRSKIANGDLSEYLSAELPYYMIPSYFIQVEEIPLNQNGKIDRRALPECSERINTFTDYTSPSNRLEEELVAIWKEILGIEKIGIDNSFFELGGQSLKAAILMYKIQKTFKTDVPLTAIFKNSTVRKLAKYIMNTAESEFASIEPVKKSGFYPLTSAQKGLFAVCQLMGADIVYNIPLVMEVGGNISKERFEEAFRLLVKRHESLRTSFQLLNGEPVQIIHDNLDFCVEYKEFAEKEIDELVNDFIRPFDLSRAPLMRVELVRLGKTRHLFLLDMHHIISDGISLGILLKEFADAYQAIELPCLHIQYKDFANWQNMLLNSNDIKQQEAYWLGVYSDVLPGGNLPVVDLPTDYPRPRIQSFEGDTVRCVIAKEFTQSLEKTALETGATMYMVLSAAYNVLLAKYTNKDDIVVGTSISGRNHEKLQNIVGMFVNMLPIRNEVSDDQKFSIFLSRVKDNALKAYENQDYQYERLVERLGAARDFSRSPLMDVVFTMQETHIGDMEFDGLKLKSYEYKNRTSKFDLALEVIKSDDGLIFDLEYCTKLLKRETAERMLNDYIKILNAVFVNIDIRIGDIELEERYETLSEASLDFGDFRF